MKTPLSFTDHRTRSVQRTTVEFEESARKLRKKAGQRQEGYFGLVSIWLFGYFVISTRKNAAVYVFRF